MINFLLINSSIDLLIVAALVVTAALQLQSKAYIGLHLTCSIPNYLIYKM